jgi:hypothetical protein
MTLKTEAPCQGRRWHVTKPSKAASTKHMSNFAALHRHWRCFNKSEILNGTIKNPIKYTYKTEFIEKLLHEKKKINCSGHQFDIWIYPLTMIIAINLSIRYSPVNLKSINDKRDLIQTIFYSHSK